MFDQREGVPTMTEATGDERSRKAQAIHTHLNSAAAAVNALHAQALDQVIEAQTWRIHRDFGGFSSLRDWLMHTFDFGPASATELAAIARTSRKFTHLAETARTGAAGIGPIAAAVRRLERVRALRLYAKTPYPEPIPSPFDPEASCPTPEHLIAQYCVHAPVSDLHRHLDELQTALDNGQTLLDGLSEQSLQRLDLVEQDNGMWTIDGVVAADTGRLFAKYLETAVPPPRQDETDEDGVLPPAANRRAEALHQMIAVYGAGPAAPTRHGHTATLNLTADLATLRGEDTGRVPLLEGRPVSVAKARLLACEAGVVPIVFDYTTGEAVEVGAYRRLPGASLRRKLEAEQPGGCAWSGCGRPVSWCEAHHLVEWWRGGPTTADNLILLCRFHHGRVHTPGWSVTKTGPGRALIVHHDDHEPTDPADPDPGDCGCADHRSAEDLEAEFAGDVADL
ncbi:HNH endonuclease signature motif containing protein, partial [Glycomyces xiaoerkulensis]|uniref:HNH endonuclease signature motif containing protein n=1 Tax=Glycomyces xiaoerkulensis TaxID=2038139 RepID=UPI000C269889